MFLIFTIFTLLFVEREQQVDPSCNIVLQREREMQGAGQAYLYFCTSLISSASLRLFMETRARANCSFVCVHHPTTTQPTYCTSLVEREKRKRFSLGAMHCPRAPRPPA